MRIEKSVLPPKGRGRRTALPLRRRRLFGYSQKLSTFEDDFKITHNCLEANGSSNDKMFRFHSVRKPYCAVLELRGLALLRSALRVTRELLSTQLDCNQYQGERCLYGTDDEF